MSENIEIVLRETVRFDQALDPQALATAMRGEVMDAIREGLQHNFDTEGKEGAGGWAALAEATLKERLRGGYGPHPILFRTGALRAELLEQGATGHVEDVTVQGGALVFDMGGSSPRFRGLNFGVSERYLPGRAMTAMSREYQEVVEEAVVETLAAYLNARLGGAR